MKAITPPCVGVTDRDRRLASDQPAAAPCPPTEREAGREGGLAALVEVLIAEVRGLRGDLARDRRPRRALSRADVDRLSRLLPALAGCFGSEPFTIAEAFEEPAVRVVTAGLAAPACGQLLQRARGVAVAGYVVEYDATELHRRVWRLEAVVTV